MRALTVIITMLIILISINATDVLVRKYPQTVQAADFRSKHSAQDSYYRGINVFGPWQNGFADQAWQFPGDADLAYYQSKGLTNLRVNLLWEDLQPQKYGNLNLDYLTALQTFLTDAARHREKVSLTFIRLEFRGNDIDIPAYIDLWQKLAAIERGNPAVWAYELVNEPYHDANWQQDGQDIINSIRKIDAAKTLIVMPRYEAPYGYDSDHSFIPFTDPSNNLVWAAHVYFDKDYSGQYALGSYDAEGAYPVIGADRAMPFVTWCDTHKARCAMNEYGIPGTWNDRPWDPRWGTVLDTLLSYLDAHHISGNYWAMGAYGDINDASPANGQDAPQMAILERHLGK